jgi:hypothetical protein
VEIKQPHIDFSPYYYDQLGLANQNCNLLILTMFYSGEHLCSVAEKIGPQKVGLNFDYISKDIWTPIRSSLHVPAT